MRNESTLRRTAVVARALCALFVVAGVSLAAGLGAPLAAEVVPATAERPAADQDGLISAARRYFPGDEVEIAPKRLFRLTRDQLDLTAGALFPGYSLPSVKETLAKDPLQTNYEYADLLAVNSANAGGIAAWVEAIAAEVRKVPRKLIDCPADAVAKPCLAAAARGFVVRAFRGDVSDERLERIVGFYLDGVQAVGPGAALAELVEVVLKSPDFLFRKEIDVDRHRRLLPAQLLQALTYTLADVPPEALGLNSEDAGTHLFKGDNATATIDRIVSSPAARAKLLRFFTSWIELKEPADFTISPQIYPEFDRGLAEAMVSETRGFLRAQLSRPDPALRDITQATRTFVSRALEPIYGTAAADPSGTRMVELDPARRLGLFSQPAVLASHSGPIGTRPIKRGVFWVRKVMCMELDPPPQGIDTALYESAHTTERQRIEQVTGQKACVGCHKVIDPFGFFLEGYDALGRWRTTDNGHPVDTRIAINFLDEGPTTTASPVEALKTFTDSLMFKQCFVRQMFRFYMGRNEEPADEPLLRQVFMALAREDRIVEAVKALALSDRIGRRQ